MDPRYILSDSNIFTRLREEWNDKKIEEYITKLFSYLSLNEGWKFERVEWKDDFKFVKRKEELKKDIYKTLVIHFKTPKGNYSLDFRIPTLINDQFFYIGGLLKIPIFQLYDYPIIYRYSKNKVHIKFRNNILSVNLIKDKNDLFKVSLFNRSMKFHELVAYTYDKEQVKEFLKGYKNIDTILKENILLKNILEQCLKIWNATTKIERTKKLGQIFSTTRKDFEKKGNSIIFSLAAAFEIDYFNKRYCKTNSIIFELLNAIIEGPRSDTDLKNKRIRFAEYILTPLIRQVYDIVISAYNTKNVKFHVPSSLLIDKCSSSTPKDRFNISHIVHYNFALNPIAELASIAQCSLAGPGGFKKENVPVYLRTIDESQKGYICPADTPDREGCGVILNLSPTIHLNEDGTFGKPSKETIVSYPISLVPFLGNDDQTRLQMASSQLKQSITLYKPEKPLIRSGTESCYLDKTTFLGRAEFDGKVIYRSSDYLIVSYYNGSKKGDVFKLGFRNMNLDVADFLMSDKKEGDKFKKGDVLYHSLFIDNGTLAYGLNLLTVIMIGRGFNYEDGIIISESAAKKFTSIHYLNLDYLIEKKHVLFSLSNEHYQPFVEEGQLLKKGEPYAKLKILNSEENLEDIQIEENRLTCPKDCIINEVEIYPNFWNQELQEYATKINELILKQSQKFDNLYEKLRIIMNENEIEKFLVLNDLSKWNCQEKKGKYFEKGKRINGIRIKIKGIYKDPIIIGDKIANRHGNKGVIAKILPDDQMPILEDGRRAEIILNPLGVISRMNVGQLFEITLTETLYQLKKKLKEINDVDKCRNILTEYLNILDKTDNKWITSKILEEFDNNVTTKDLHYAIDELYLIQPIFKCIKVDDLKKLTEFVNAKYTQKLFDPLTNSYFDNPITVGYIYFFKLIHRASEKMSGRSIGPYSNKTLQPLGGKSNQGGHRFGEMEVWGILGHGAKNQLKDFLTTQSDSVGLKSKLLADIIRNPDLLNNLEEIDEQPQSLKLLNAYLKVLGIEISYDE
jgi:DNA-directed RNA polymerase beta subunit